MRADLMIARVTARRATRSAAVWGVVFAVYLAASALGYVATYPHAPQRKLLAAGLGSNAGINAIFGPAHRIDTVGGFVEWRGVGLLSLIAAVWGLLAGTRLLRGEEDAGRWEVLLAGRTTRRRAPAEAVAGLFVGFALLWVVPAFVTVAVGSSQRVGFTIAGSLGLVLASVAAGAVFLLVGAVSSQVMSTRRQAAALAGGLLAAAYAVRAVADAGSGTGWLRWLTPLGWPELLRPMTAPDPVAALPIVGSLVVLAAATVVLAGRRDLDASLLADRTHARRSTRLLGSPLTLTMQLARPLAIGWTLAVFAAGLLFGLVAKTAAQAVADAGSAQAELARFGARGFGARAYLGVAFLIVAALIALAGSASVAALRGEEAEGRLDHLLARPVSRAGWLLGRLGVATVLLVCCGLVAAVGAWLGATTQDAGVGLTVLLRAGVNVLPPALLVLGLGVLAFGVRPRLASAACYAVVAWSFLVLMVGAVLRANHWLLDTSLLRHMAAAPAVSPDWTSAAVFTGLAAAAAAAGVYAFSRRDLAGE